MLATTLAFSKAHAALCSSQGFNGPSDVQQTSIQPPAHASVTGVLGKALETIRNERFEHLLDHLITSCEGAVNSMGSKDVLQPLPALDVSSIDGQPVATTTAGPSIAAWGECSDLPMRWYQALLTVFCPLHKLLGFTPSVIGPIVSRLRSLLQSTCQAFVQACRYIELMTAACEILCDGV